MLYNESQKAILSVAIEMLYAKASGELFSTLPYEEKVEYVVNNLKFHLCLDIYVEKKDSPDPENPEYILISKLQFSPDIENLSIHVLKDAVYNRTLDLLTEEILSKILSAYFLSLYDEPEKRKRDTFISCILTQSIMDISIKIKKDGSIKLDTKVGTGDIFR